MLLSVVVPAYREGSRLCDGLALLRRSIDGIDPSVEVIVVVDGPDDATAAAAEAAGADLVIKLPTTRGKGYAVRRGIRASRGERVAFIDADMELHPDGIATLVALLDEGADAAVGSKRHPRSDVSYPPLRRVQSAAYAALVRAVFGLRLSDTQAGLKAFDGELARSVEPTLTCDGFAFDLELLLALRDRGARIVEGPVRVEHTSQSSTSLGTAFGVLADAARIWWRRRGR